MTQLLFGGWGPQLAAYSLQHPWHIFALALAVFFALDLMFRKNRTSSGGDAGIGGWDDGDGDSCGD
jgi:hypothetical protein